MSAMIMYESIKTEVRREHAPAPLNVVEELFSYISFSCESYLKCRPQVEPGDLLSVSRTSTNLGGGF